MKIDQIKEKIQIALQESKNNLFAFSQISANKVDFSRIKNDLNSLILTYMEELDNVESINFRNSEAKNINHKLSIEKRLNGGYIDLFVVISVCGGEENETKQAIESVSNNLFGLNFCIVLVVHGNYVCGEFFERQNINYILIRDSKRLSLPESYNLAINFIKNDIGAKDSLVGFLDDDAYIIKNQQQIIINNLKLVKNDRFLAVSGHCYDTRKLSSSFFKSIKFSSTFEFMSKIEKPYCHGGALMFMKIKNYPQNGLLKDGLGGLNLMVGQIGKLSDKRLREMILSGQWFLYNNTKLKIHHRIKENIIRWSATYLSYEKGWKAAMDGLKPLHARVWRERLNSASVLRQKMLWKEYEHRQPSSLFALGNILLTRYYKPLLSKYFSYKELSNFSLRSHKNLV